MERNKRTEEDLDAIQKNIEKAAGKVAHRTKAQREKTTMSTPEHVRLREEAAARCIAKIREENTQEASKKSQS